MTEFAAFAAAPIGPGLVALDNGVTLTTLANALSIARTARVTVFHATGTRGAEFAFTGDDPLVAAVGAVRQGASLAVMAGADAEGIAWRLDTGTVHSGNLQLASGLPAVAKGEIVGVRLRLDTGHIDFYKGNAVVHSRPLPSGGGWAAAASLASTVAGGLLCTLNAGQWIAASPAAQAGWAVPEPVIAPVRLSDYDYLARSTDPVPHARYEGLVESSQLTIASGVHFWPWGGSPPVQGSSARVRVMDPDGVLDALAQDGIAGVPVRVRLGNTAGSVADAAAIARFRCVGIEAVDDMSKVFTFTNPHEDLDQPIHRVVFPRSLPGIAWKPVPVVIGAVASVPVIPVNSDGSVGWVSDKRVYVQTVYDRGDPLEAGTWQMDPSGEQILFNSPPLGPVTCDCSSIGAGMQPATFQQTLADLMARIGKSAWSSADAAAIDAQTGYAGAGIYAADATSVRQAMVRLCMSYGAWWYEDGDGVLRFVRVVAPESVPDGQLAFDLQGADLLADMKMAPDAAPNLTRSFAFKPNAYVHQAGELVTDLVDVPPARRVELMQPYGGLAYSAAVLARIYGAADNRAPFESCLWRRQDAEAELARVMAMYAVPRFRYLWTEQNAALAPKPGQVGRITFDRYGLQAGKKVLVAASTRNPVTGETGLTVWG
jgi:hypothetical protein